MVLALNPVIEALGQIGAIVICLFAFVFILVAVAFNLAMAFGLSWVREKARLLQMLRPQVESVNTVAKEAVQGVSPSSTYENGVVRAVASIPARVNGVDHKVEQSTQRVADAVIEFRARTIQAQTIVKALFLPGLMKHPQPALTAPNELIVSNPGYRGLLEKSAPEKPISITNSDGQLKAEAGELDGQLKHASSR